MRLDAWLKRPTRLHITQSWRVTPQFDRTLHKTNATMNTPCKIGSMTKQHVKNADVVVVKGLEVKLALFCYG